MGRVIAYRLSTAVPLLLATSLFSFLLLHLAPGSPIDLLRANPAMPEGVVAEIARRFGLDQPWYRQYAAWLGGVVRGDFGPSLTFQRPVADLLALAVPRTLALAAVGHLAAFAFGLGLALLAVRRPGEVLDRGLHRGGLLLASVHPVVLANVGLVIAFLTGWVPIGGGSTPGESGLGALSQGRDYLAHLVLPAAILSLAMLPGFLLQSRGALAGVRRAPYVTAARAAGLSEPAVLLRHVLPASGVAVLGYAGASLARLLSVSFLVEVVTGWPGMGRLALQALSNHDPFLLLGTLLVAATLLTFGHLAADVALAGADPRVRLEEASP